MQKRLPTEEMQILLLLQENREEAIREIHSRYGEFLLMVANSILRDERDAEECVSDVLLRLWNVALPKDILSFKAYLAKMVRNRALMFLRSKRRQKRGGDFVFVSYEELSECIPETEQEIDEEKQTRIREQLNSFLQSLSKENRTIFMGRYWLSLSVSEIAKQTEKSEKYVLKKLFVLRQKLKRHLEDG